MAESRGLDRAQYEDSEWSAAIELVGLSNPAIHRSPTSAAAAAASEVSTKYEEVKSVPNGPGEANAFKKPDAIVPCARCNSMETKFCYFNNYNENQPRHFCRTCKRYWTVGGAMRDVPEGSGRRWNKQPSNSRHAIKPSNGDVLDTPHCLSRIVKPPVVPSWTNGVWGSPWSGSSVTTLPSLPPNNVAYPGGDYLALGKHPREANLQEEAEAEKTFWVPKALRVTNPEEVAKSSIWDSLGIKPDERLLFWKC